MFSISERLSQQNIEFLENAELSHYCTFKIGGTADFLVFPDTEDKLIASVKIANEVGIPYAVIGNASNILFADAGYSGMIISTKKLQDISVGKSDERESEMTCACGAMLPKVSSYAAEHSLSGIEFACGIPGTIGGAIFMNAGAHGGAISDVLISSRAYDVKKDKIITLSSAQHDFGYRESVYMSDPSLICLSVTLRLVNGNIEDIKRNMKENTEKRRSTQPLTLPSAGSFFKRPEGYFSARLIDECGLKGLREGNAAVSEKHAGFIVNLGDAILT